MRSAAAPHPQMACVDPYAEAPLSHRLSYPGEEAAGAQEVYDVWGFHDRLGGPKEKRISFRPLIS